MPKIQNEQYVLLPCSGWGEIGIPRGHLYKVNDREGKELGWATKEKAFKKYGKDNCYLSGSDTACSICYEKAVGTLQEKLEFPLNLIK